MSNKADSPGILYNLEMMRFCLAKNGSKRCYTGRVVLYEGMGARDRCASTVSMETREGGVCWGQS